MNLYKPQGVPRSDLQEVILKVEELEAIRLKDLLGLEQEESAQQMQVSRSTFQRVLNDARYKIAKALIKGNAIRIEGGDYCLGGGYCRRHERYLRGNEVCVRGREILTVKDAQRADKSWRRVAICSSGTSPLSPIDERFGRCAYFMVWDPLTKQYTSLANSGIKAGHGMGLDAIQALIETKVGFVLTQRIGVNAFTVLKEKGIKVFSGGTGKTVETVLKSYENGEMRELRNANG